MKLKKKFFNFCPTIFLVTLSLIFFHKFFLNRLIPIPTDITVGMYYPWLNSKWGNIVGVAVKNPLMSDIVSIIYQWRMTAINAIKSGNFPFWNPYYFLGMPLFANFQNSLINLTNLPFFLPIKTATAWGLMIYFQLLFSLFSAFIYLKSIGLKNISAFLGSIIFAFSLFNITWLEYGIHTYVASFLPLMLSTIEKKKFTLMSILIALQIYGGYPQYSIYSLIFITFYFLILHSNKNFKKILLFLIYIILGLSLAAPLLIPGLQLITRSIHSIDITAQTSNQGFLPLKNLFTAISPNFWGNPATSDYQGKGFYDNNAFYPGIFALLAFFYWLFNKKSKLVKFFLFSIPIVFLLAISNPISFFLKNNFGVIFSKNGISTRIFLISNLAFSVLSAFLIENLLNKKQAKAQSPEGGKRSIIIFPVLLIFIWQIFLLFLSKFKPTLLLSTVAFKNTLYGLLFGLPILFSLLLINFFKNKTIKSLLLSTIIIISTLELFYLGWKYLPFTPAKYLFPITPSIEFVRENSQHDRIATLNTIPENMWIPYGLKSPDGYDATVPLLNYEYLLLTQELKFPQNASRARKITNINSPLFNSLSVKYFFHNKDYFLDIDKEKQSDFSTVFTEEKIEIIKNKNSLARARFVNNPIVVDSKDKIAKALTTQFDKNLVVFYSKNAPDNTKLENIKKCQPNNSNITFIKDGENSIELQTTSDCPQILLLSDAYYPEWKAKIDQQSTQIYQANHAFRTILVPAGTHTIKFYYQSTAFLIGISTSGLSLLILILINKNHQFASDKNIVK